MTSDGPRKIINLILEIFMPCELDSQKSKIHQRFAYDCQFKLNLESSLDIKLNWHQRKIQKNTQFN